MDLGVTEIGAIAAGLCVLLAVGLFGLFVVIALFRFMRRRGEQAAEAAVMDALPDEIKDVMDVMNTELRGISDPDERRAAMLKRFEPGLGYLGDPQIENLPDGGTRFTGTIGEGAVLEITGEGTVAKLEAKGDFAFGGLTLKSGGDHADPDSHLGRMDVGTVAELVDQMGEVGVSEISFGKTLVSVSVEGSVYDNELGSMKLDVGAMLSMLENSVSAWDWLEPDPEPEPEPEPTSPLAEGETEAIRALFDAIAVSVEDPKLKIDPDQMEQELRGRIDGIGVRLVVEDDGRWHVQALADVGGCAFFKYDPELSPISADPDDPFAADDTVRVFVAKGLYVEGTQDDIDAYMEWLAGTTEAQVEQVRMALSHLPLREIAFSVDEFFIWGKASLGEADDPVGLCRSALELAGRLCREHGDGTSRELKTLKCTYCSSRYFFGPMREACPNCGAPPEA